MGGLAPRQLKSRRGSHSSPRRLHIDSASLTGFQELRGKLYQFCGTADILMAIARGSLALSGPPTWPSLMSPPTQVGRDIPDLPVSSAFGETPAEASAELEIARFAWLEAARAEPIDSNCL